MKKNNLTHILVFMSMSTLCGACAVSEKEEMVNGADRFNLSCMDKFEEELEDIEDELLDDFEDGLTKIKAVCNTVIKKKNTVCG